MLKYLKYSGIWCGIIVNPHHWVFKYYGESEDVLFSKSIMFGPIWITIVIDNGKW